MITRWKHAMLRLDCSCNVEVNPNDVYNPGDTVTCTDHGDTTIVRWSRSST